MPTPLLRPLRPADWHEIADLIYISVNHYYQSHGLPSVFCGGPAATLPFCTIYEALDPGCCLVAEHPETHRLMGSCFYHPRETHVSLGIMTVHPVYFGRGIARLLLKHITDLADARNLPTRLVSSAMNLDSYSLYNRAGFVPRCIYQDIILQVPEVGLPELPGTRAPRDATPDDLDAVLAVEADVGGIRRSRDYQFFLANASDWHFSVLDAADKSRLDGFLVSHSSSRFTTVGPGVARDGPAAAALLRHELHHCRGNKALVLCPAEYPELVRLLYSWGGKNTEIHFAQVRGAFAPFAGPTFPTFMPESG